jgi:hypothetical protein
MGHEFFFATSYTHTITAPRHIQTCADLFAHALALSPLSWLLACGQARQGLETRTLDFGGFSGIPGFAPIAAVFQIAGWEIGKNYFGVPFDWRLPSPALENTFTQMRELIENVTASTGKKAS